ncbi:unnamed protein product, partial [Acidithrix sp. C25]
VLERYYGTPSCVYEWVPPLCGAAAVFFYVVLPKTLFFRLIN